MSSSINTNVNAMTALQNLNNTSKQLQQTQNKVSTGLKVNSASDDGAVWAIAQNERAQSGSLDAVTQSLQRAQSTVDVATSAGSSISDLLNQTKEKALAASDPSLDSTSLASLNTDFQALLDQITTTVNNASFNGTNLLDGSSPNGITALTSADGSSTLTIAAQNLTLSGLGLGSYDPSASSGATNDISTVAGASQALTYINSAISKVATALGNLGAGSNLLSTQTSFVSNLQDTINTGIGNLVNADLAKESASLQALQTKQQLGVQSLSIANQSSANLLSLFK